MRSGSSTQRSTRTSPPSRLITRPRSTKRSSWTRTSKAQKVQATDLNRKSIDYSVLQREAESNRQVYESLLQREKELRVVSNSRANNVRLLDRAEMPGAPFTPNTRRAWMMALLFGLGIGIAAAFAIDYLDDTVKTPEDVTWRLHLNFLGLVPKVHGERHPLLSGPVPHDFGEAFRALRTALVASSGTDATHLIAITSTQPLEGKTTTAVNIALALAIGGARVLLIDADMRRPSLHKAMRLPNDRGLAELLSGKARMREVVQRCGDPNLLVIPAGHTPSNPSELLGVRSHARVPAAARDRTVRLGHHRYAARARGHRRRRARAARPLGLVRHRRRDDAVASRGTSHRNPAGRPSDGRLPLSSIELTSTVTATTTRDTTATSTRAITRKHRPRADSRWPSLLPVGADAAGRVHPRVDRRRYTWPTLPTLIAAAGLFLVSGARVGADPVTRSLDVDARRDARA